MKLFAKFAKRKITLKLWCFSKVTTFLKKINLCNELMISSRFLYDNRNENQWKNWILSLLIYIKWLKWLVVYRLSQMLSRCQYTNIASSVHIMAYKKFRSSIKHFAIRFGHKTLIFLLFLICIFNSTNLHNLKNE